MYKSVSIATGTTTRLDSIMQVEDPFTTRKARYSHLTSLELFMSLKYVRQVSTLDIIYNKDKLYKGKF